MKRDPVCGMTVSDTDSSLTWVYQGNSYSFCSAGCLQAFQKNPKTFLTTNLADLGKIKGKSIASGCGAALLLIALFFVIVTTANKSLASALQEFGRLWYWILLLAGGFGLQLGLFVYLKNVVHGPLTGATAEVAASGTISTGSMVACCSHALITILPILGLSALAAFLARYQLPLLLLGVFSNLFGLTIILGLHQKHQLWPADSLISRLNMKTLRYLVIVAGLTAIGYSLSLA